MNNDTSEVVNLLRSIDASLKQMLAKSKAATPKPIADDRDLDSQYGDETIRLIPRDWTGQPYKGMRMSETEPAFLDMLADTYAYFAEKNEKVDARLDNGKPKADYDHRSERRARGWAKRLRERGPSRTTPTNGDAGQFAADPHAAFATSGFEDEVPF